MVEEPARATQSPTPATAMWATDPGPARQAVLQHTRKVSMGVQHKNLKNIFYLVGIQKKNSFKVFRENIFFAIFATK